MRALGYWVVDRVIEHFEHGPDEPAIRTATPGWLMTALGGPVPEEPGDPYDALEALTQLGLGHMQHGDHPRYFARIPGPSSYAGVLGDWLGTGFNAIAASWAGGSGPTAVELVVIDWLRELLGMPGGTEGILTSGGSIANLTALTAARCAHGPGVAYLSDQTHASIPRALRTLGFAPEEIRILPTDDRFRMSPATVHAAACADRNAGRRPSFIIATAGTTNTGAVDPLPELADLSASEGWWLHVDAAYGGPAALCAEGATLLAGLERVDSLTLDPHKWLFQPYDVGCVLVRHPGALERAFSLDAEYLRDVRGVDDEVDLRDRGLELSRRSRALKLWLTFRIYGVTHIRKAIERGIALAKFAEEALRADSAWEVVTPANLAIVTFVRSASRADDARLRASLVGEDGSAAVSSTSLHGRHVLRLCTINPRTTETDVTTTIRRLADLRV